MGESLTTAESGSGSEKELALVRSVGEAYEKIANELSKRIVGQKDVIRCLLIALFSRGHSLIIGVPGLAKTLIISTLAECLNLSFNRVQFTPDLMPSDITGSEVLEEDVSTGKRYFKFLQGPIFTNILLADEINRTPPKTQAALLQAMQEYRVTAGGKTYRLDLPFLVYATQNPIELEGTYPLPEAQLDRFMFSINIGYPGMNEECEIIKNTTSGEPGSPERVLSPAEILLFQDEVLKVPVADSLVSKTVAFVRMTRPSEQSAPDFVRDYVAWGASLRASQCLIIGGKASALLGGRFSVSPEDIKSIIYQVLEHRIIVNFKAEAEGVTSREIIRRLLESNPIK